MASDIETDPKIGPEETEIISFITKRINVGWTGMKNEFVVKRKWNYSTFVTRWNNIKDKYVEKVKNPKTGLPWYKIRETEQAKTVGEKAVLKTDITEGKLSSVAVEISPERYAEVAEQIAQLDFNVYKTAMDETSEGFKIAEEKIAKEGIEEPKNLYERVEKKYNVSSLRDESQKKGIIKKIKDTVSRTDDSDAKPKPIAALPFIYTALFNMALEKEKAMERLRRVCELVKIQIVTSPSETVPLLTDDDIKKILDIVIPKAMDENKSKPREKPFQLIISFPNFKTD
ncbi:MAG: hypothetical protein ABSA79_00115 [Candidatus Bathyarchaeia archaeon]